MDKLIRSKVPLTYTDKWSRKQETNVIAMQISLWSWNENRNRYEAEVTDFKVVENPVPKTGDPLFFYEPINKVPRVRKKEQINGLFAFFAIPIGVEDDMTDKLRDLYVKGLLYDTQTNPTYGSSPEDWEIIDREEEVAE